MLEIHELSASYEGAGTVIADVTLQVPRGWVECIIGPSGCGKTTLLLAAAGLKSPDRGTVLLNGQAVSAGDTRVSLVLQQYGLLPWLTAAGNAALGLRVRGTGRRERAAAAREMLARVGLASRAGSFPAEMSGGEQQRVAIARALSLSPRLLLLDEPFSALDAITRESLQDLLVGLLEGSDVGAVVVTHSLEEAAYLGDSISLLAGSPGTIVDRFENPGRRSRGFRSSGRYFELENLIRRAMEKHKVIPHEH
jgi:NitT/TauT family transport system ATP-binding protein